MAPDDHEDDPAAATGTALETLEARLDRMEGEGARGFDAPACDCVRNLVLRAEAMPGNAGARLLQRAEHHLDRLSLRYQRERERAEVRLSRLREQGIRTEGVLVRYLERGELTRIHRLARRARAAESRTALSVAGGEHGAATGADALGRRRRSALHYEDSAAELMATFALSHAADSIPPDAGPYNATLLAHRTLDTMRRISPLYLRTQLERLDELGGLLSLPAPAPPPAAPRKRPVRRGANRKKAH